jgi:hypothetical protein
MFLRICIIFLAFNAWAEAQTAFLNLWPSTPPGPATKTDGLERDLTKPEDKLIAGRKII